MNKHLFSRLFATLIFLLCLAACKNNNNNNNKTDAKLISSEIKSLFNNYKPKTRLIDDSILLTSPDETLSSYDTKSYNPFWIEPNGLTENGKSLIKFIENATSYGLMPEAYNSIILSHNYNSILVDTLWANARKDSKNWAKLDLMLTDAFLSISRHLDRGYVPLDSLKKDNTYNPEKYKDGLYKIYENKDLKTMLESFEPSSIAYKNIKKQLPQFIKNADLSKKYTYLEYPIKNSEKFIKNLITRSKEENLIPNRVQTLDSLELSELIKKIQQKKNIIVDGKYGRQLVLALNNSDYEKYLKIVINMDRLRRNRETYPKKYLWVNLPSFYLQVYDNGEAKVESKVIIGKPNTRTPLITSKINEITTYPNWTIPSSIISKEILPNIKKNNGYLNRKGYTLYDTDGNLINPDSVNWSGYEKGIPYKVVQPGGDTNSLGIMKFNFPNKYSVYLHDTNQRGLFNNDYRSLSHGCVRVQNWDSLYKYIILSDIKENEDATSKSIIVDSVKTWLSSKKRKNIPVINELPIFIRYFTAESKNGKIELYEDVYGEDNKIRNMIIKSITPSPSLN
jgi:murein L,D-transpeptidase YcbB/YkuD